MKELIQQTTGRGLLRILLAMPHKLGVFLLKVFRTLLAARAWRNPRVLLVIVSMTLPGYRGFGNTLSNAVPRYTCTVYEPPSTALGSYLDELLIDGIEDLKDNDRLLEAATSAFDEVIAGTDGDDQRYYIAQNNLACAYLKLASAVSGNSANSSSRESLDSLASGTSSPIVAISFVSQPINQGSNNEDDACNFVAKAKGISATMPSDIILGIHEAPNIPIPDCSMQFDVGLEFEEAFYSVHVVFLLPSVTNLHSAQVEPSNFIEQEMLLPFLLVQKKRKERDLPLKGVYCYELDKLQDLDGEFLSSPDSPELGAIHIQNGETYVLRSYADGWHLQEINGKNEMIIAAALTPSEIEQGIQKEIRIESSSGNDVMKLDANSNRRDTTEIEVDSGESLSVSMTEVITLTNGSIVRLNGLDELHALNTGQLYTIEQLPGNGIVLQETTCNALANELEADSEVRRLSYGDSVDSEGISRTGERWIFSGSADDQVKIILRREQNDTSLTLYTSSGAPLPLNYTCTNPEVDSWLYTLPETEDYTIIVRGNNRTSGPYTLTIEWVEEIGEPSTYIQRGDPIQDAVAESDTDVWKFRGCAGDSVDIIMMSLTIYTELRLYDSSGELIDSDYESPGDGYSEIYIDALPETGNYYIRATSRDGNAGDYTLTLR